MDSAAHASFDDLPLEFLIPADIALLRSLNPALSESSEFSSGSAVGNRQRLKPHAERKAEVVSKLHSLPLKTFYTRETLSNWSLPRLHKELKYNDAVPKEEDMEKDQLVEQLYGLNLKEGETGSSSESCGICCEDYEDEEVLRSLNCQHVFHVECIDRWAISSTVYSKPPECPMCKREI